MQDSLPPNEYYEYFAPDYQLHIPCDREMENLNNRQNLEKVSHAAQTGDCRQATLVTDTCT
jgi:hypothetical protein